MIRLISTDFDGTLVDHDASPAFAPELIQLLSELRARGVVWAINTGRAVGHIVEGLEHFRFPFAPDFILTSERHVFRPAGHGNGWEAFGDWNDRCDLAHEELFVAAREIIADIERFVKSETRGQVIYEDGKAAGLLATSEEEMDRMVDFLTQAGARHPLFHFQRNTIYVRFCHREYSKGAALGELGRLLEIPREEIFAVGDHYNDISMLDGRFAGWPACPANAALSVQETVRAAGGYVAQRSFSDGVVEALRACLGGRESGTATRKIRRTFSGSHRG